MIIAIVLAVLQEYTNKNHKDEYGAETRAENWNWNCIYIWTMQIHMHMNINIPVQMQTQLNKQMSPTMKINMNITIKTTIQQIMQVMFGEYACDTAYVYSVATIIYTSEY